jgi:DNA-directed RNA polymerase specialized sigma24 family protein
MTTHDASFDDAAAEIANALTISIPAVKRCLMRARERFATLYQEGLPEGGTV